MVAVKTVAETLVADTTHIDALIAKLSDTFEQRDAAAFAALFHDEGTWRDVLAFTWHYVGATGQEAIESAMAKVMAKTEPRDLGLLGEQPIREVSRAGREVYELLMTFETAVGPCRAVARLLDTDDGLKIWTLATTLEEIRGHEDRVKRTANEFYIREDFGGDNWLDRRNKAREYTDHEPDVLVVGGGQCGLAIAARLGQLEMDALIVDAHERIGDCWRKRYHSLTLHNQTHIAHFPYMDFPATYPMWLPKDKMANWYESYVDAMELNYWTSSRFEAGNFDEASGRWDVVVNRDGVERRLRPKHIVMATGVCGKPWIPDFPGLNDFNGEVMHSSMFTSGTDYVGKRVVILGVGNSSHDVAQDLHTAGAEEVTMIQRGPITVVNVELGNVVYSLFNEGLPTSEADLLLTATPYLGVVEGFQAVSELVKEEDAELLKGLEEAGMKLDWGHDNTGFQMKYFRKGGGYYLNVGCSDLIISGDVKLRHFEDFDRIVPEGVRMKDGSVIEADVLISGTGYESQQDLVRSLFNDEVADNVGQVWGFGEDGEIRSMWKRTGQPNLWFHAGSLTQSRVMSKFLALQIKARELGLIDAQPPEPSGSTYDV